MRKVLLLFVLLLGCTVAWAEDLKFRTEAPEAVVSGDQFRLCFIINTQNVSNFRAPAISGFEVLMGPSRSTQSSTQIINGNVSTSSSITFTYILQADKTGTFKIPGATITAGGKTLTSNGVSIRVLPPDQGGSRSGAGSAAGSSRSEAAAANRPISGKDLFITATANRTTVYEQEPILLTYKVYTTVNLVELNGKMPDLKGFHTQEVELPRQKQFHMEHYNGRNYNTLTWSQYVMFPLQAGTLEIPSITYEGLVQQVNRSVDPFDAFFNGGSNVVEVKKSVKAPAITIHVKPLPSNKPASYCNAVGDFKISSSLNSNKVKTGDALTLKVVISGTGNMKLVSNPQVEFPKDFETYDPKVTDKFTLTKDGLSGNKIIEYLAVPRHAGTFKIPPVEFSYFDLKSGAYKTLKTEEYTVTVEKGAGNANQAIANFTNKEDVEMLNQDIRFIKMNDNKLNGKGSIFFASVPYILCYVIPFILFVVFVIVNRKRIIENANVAKVKTKRANKVAIKRLKLAGKLLSENKRDEFYDEVLRALWGYVSDKMSIPVSQLSKDNIGSEMQKYGASDELIKNYMESINECEFARYAPGDASKAMDKVYDMAMNAITQMENTIK